MGEKSKRYKKSKRCKHCKKGKEKEETGRKANEFHLVSLNIESMSTKSIDITDSIWATGAPSLWSRGYMGEGVIVGIIDTGIDDTHPVLTGKVVKRRDYIKDGRKTIEFNPHGTHVAGTLAADANNLKGIAPKVKLHDYRVLDINGSGSYANITKAIKDAVDDGCHIINMSLGGPSPHAPLQSVLKYAVSKGVLVICAAGNEGANKISYPAYYPEVISVGAVQFDPSTGNLTLPETPWFSNTNTSVDLCGDGWNVFSCIPNKKYAVYSGTSMATPSIAGMAALLRCRLSQKLGRNPTFAELNTVLRENTVDVPQFPSILEGTGFVTIYPEIPKKENGNWILPNFLKSAP